MLEDQRLKYEENLRNAAPEQLTAARLLQNAAGVAPDYPGEFTPAPVYLAQAMSLTRDLVLAANLTELLGRAARQS